MNKALIFIFISALASCSIQKRQARHCLKCPEKLKITDSTYYREIERLKHVIVELESDSGLSVVKFLPCPDGSMPKIENIRTQDGKTVKVRSAYKPETGELKTKAIQQAVKKDVYIPEKMVDKTAKRVESVVKQADCDCRSKFMVYAIGMFALFCLIWFVDKRKK